MSDPLKLHEHLQRAHEHMAEFHHAMSKIGYQNDRTANEKAAAAHEAASETLKNYNKTKEGLSERGIALLRHALHNSTLAFNTTADHHKWTLNEELEEDGGAGVPTNTVGSGAIAGSGGAGGEPGVSPEAARKYKNRNRKNFIQFVRRKDPKFLQ